MTQLERLLRDIDPSNTIDLINAKVDSAFNSFHWDLNDTSEWDGFRDYICRFYRHMSSSIYGSPPSIADDYDYNIGGQIVLVLKDIYGEDGLAISFNMAKSGVDGGLYRVLKDVINYCVKDAAERRIKGQVMACIGGFSFEEIQRMASEYIEKYNHIIPQEMKAHGAYWLTKNFEYVLCQHPYIIKAFREISK